MIHIYVTIIDVTDMKLSPGFSPMENNLKLLYACGMLSCNTSNYLIKRQS